MNASPTVTYIFTDGGCDPNPGPGGWGAVLLYGPHRQELSGAEAHTTNNRMELTAAIEALRALKRPCRVEIVTDSEYLKRGVTEWLPRWVAQGWRRAHGQPIENLDLWKQLVEELGKHTVSWRWIRGHSGHPMNERADALARAAREGLTRAKRAAVKEADPIPRIEAYTRGCALGAPGPGGYAAILRRPSGETWAVSGARGEATANQMELQAAIAALQAVGEPAEMTIYTPSKYVLDGATKWLPSWRRNGWQTRTGEAVKHREAWEELGHLMERHRVQWHHLPPDGDTHSAEAVRLARQEAESLRAIRRPT